MTVTIQLTSHADAARGETEREREVFTVQFKRNGDARSKFLRAIAESIKQLAARHNAKFDSEHQKPQASGAVLKISAKNS
mgnify:FL=1